MQVQNDYTRGFEGAGLGLSLVKGLVALHEGTMSIESAPGEGTTVTISLPVDGPRERPDESAVVAMPTHKKKEDGTIQKIMHELARKGLKVDHYAAAISRSSSSSKAKVTRPMSHPLFSIPEILEKIIEIGRRGMQIKRFKGLGEMNAKELFNTTMDPEKRKLSRLI